MGRPIFFSVLITILSFLPVFALSGREGKMFHPLAYTKTFALVGVALLSITLVPALDPDLPQGPDQVGGRELAGPDDDRDLQADAGVADGPDDAGLLAVRGHPRAGLRRLDEAGPRVHARPGRESHHGHADDRARAPRSPRRSDDLRVRDAVLRGFPEVWQVVGKAGRAETPTDPAPLDMVETVINLRDREVWPKRKLRFEDAVAQTRVVLDALEAKGLLRRPASAEERDGLVNEAAMTVASTVDEMLRDLAVAAAGGVPPGAGPRPGRRGDRRPARPGRTRRPSPAS